MCSENESPFLESTPEIKTPEDFREWLQLILEELHRIQDDLTCYPADFFDDPKRVFLFNVPLGAESTLDSREISDVLRRAIDENDVPLTRDAQVVVLNVGLEWWIYAGNDLFKLSKNAESLNIYRGGYEPSKRPGAPKWALMESVADRPEAWHWAARMTQHAARAASRLGWYDIYDKRPSWTDEYGSLSISIENAIDFIAMCLGRSESSPGVNSGQKTRAKSAAIPENERMWFPLFEEFTKQPLQVKHDNEAFEAFHEWLIKIKNRKPPGAETLRKYVKKVAKHEGKDWDPKERWQVQPS